MKRYFKIKDGRRRVFVRVTTEPRTNLDGVTIMSGVRITPEGDEFETANQTGVTHEVIVFAENNVVGEYEMSVHYARLVPMSRYA